MEKFCLIGERLAHSYSATIHQLLGYDYDLVCLKPDEVENFVRGGKYPCFNVTIPYKKKVMEYLDDVSNEAVAIGAVNTVVTRGGKHIGFNTDIDGFAYLFKHNGISVLGKKVVILGSGGTGVMAQYYARREGAADVIVVSRDGKDNYQNLDKHFDAQIIVNATPVGMYPNNGASPIVLDNFKRAEYVVDVIYNPMMTKLLLDAKRLRIPYQSGLLMLVAQAVYAKGLFFDTNINDAEIKKVYNQMLESTKNIVLMGMPSSGKTTIGALVAKRLGRPFVDVDQAIERAENMSVSQIFATHGESYFRAAEVKAMASFGKEHGQVIALGGGAVVNDGAYDLIKQNGDIFYLKRSREKADFEGRPLLRDQASYDKLLSKRSMLYDAFADYIVDNVGEPEQTVNVILEKL